jgi:PAS domain S-box-containing protein
LSFEPMFAWKLDGVVEFWNVGAERLYGFAPNEAMGRTSHDLLQTKFPHEFSAIRSKLQSDKTWSGELHHICKDGREVIVDSRMQLLPDRTVLEVNRDISELKTLSANQETLAREVEHRSKNLLAAVQATVNLSNATTVEGLKEAIRGRIRALADVNSIFVETRWTGAELSIIAKQELAPYFGENEKSVRIDGPQITLKSAVAQAVAISLHELDTNSAKYGALSTPTGRIELTWTVTEGNLELRWAETGGPAVQMPASRGFGSKLVEQMIGALKGIAHFDWRPEGVVCNISLKTTPNLRSDSCD